MNPRSSSRVSVAVINAGTGNLRSVAKALETVGAQVTVMDRPEDLEAADRIVLPGVGAFGECMKNLKSGGWIDVLDEEVRQKGKPFLGICLGMQILAHEGYEHGFHEGLRWLPGRVRPLNNSRQLRVPHMGWNTVYPTTESWLFQGLGPEPVLYFAHSYHFVSDRPEFVIATCNYGGPVAVALHDRNLWAVQFHPEKSQMAGLKLLRNFVTWPT